MKKLLVLIALSLGISASAQFTLEQTYDNTATWNFCQGNVSQLLMINFEQSGERYVRLNRCGKYIKLYDLNHSLIKTISLAGLPTPAPPYNNQLGDFLYFSENLFNTDAKMEYMYVLISPFKTYVFNEDGTQLFYEPAAPIIRPNYHQQQYPIYNTSQGTKLILSYDVTNQAKVFGLGGSLSTAIQAANSELVAASAISGAIPNPSSSQSRIDYSLPKGITEGAVVFYNLEGKEIRRFHVDNSFDHLLLTTADLSSGTYFYRLETAGNSSDAKKIVVIH